MAEKNEFVVSIPDDHVADRPIQASIFLPSNISTDRTGTENSISQLIQGEPGLSRECTVICHGLLLSRHTGFVPYIAKKLPGIVVTFDMHGCGETQGPFSLTGYDDDVRDIATVCTYLQAEPLGLKVWSLIGHSRGANDVLFFAAEKSELTPHLRNVVAVSARFHLEELFPRALTTEQLENLEQHGQVTLKHPKREIVVTREEKRKLESLKPSDILQKIPSRIQIQILHGTDDERIPCNDAFDFHSSLPESELIIIEGANHFFSNLNAHQERERMYSTDVLLSYLQDFLFPKEANACL